jgi:membrane protein involved in colicin uptake
MAISTMENRGKDDSNPLNSKGWVDENTFNHDDIPVSPHTKKGLRRLFIQEQKRIKTLRLLGHTRKDVEARIRAKEEEIRQAEEEARRKAEEARRKAEEEEVRLKAEKEARLRAQETAEQKAEDKRREAKEGRRKAKKEARRLKAVEEA